MLTGEFLIQGIFCGSNGKQRIASYVGDMLSAVTLRRIGNEFQIGLLPLVPFHNTDLYFWMCLRIFLNPGFYQPAAELGDGDGDNILRFVSRIR